MSKTFTRDELWRLVEDSEDETLNDRARPLLMDTSWVKVKREGDDFNITKRKLTDEPVEVVVENRSPFAHRLQEN